MEDGCPEWMADITFEARVGGGGSTRIKVLDMRDQCVTRETRR